MPKYFQYGIRSVAAGPDDSGFELGRRASLGALGEIQKFPASFAMAFISGELDVVEVHRGLVDSLDGIPLIGTSTAGEIDDKCRQNTVTVVVVASPFIKACVGFGRDVSSNPERAARTAVRGAGIESYFDVRHCMSQMLGQTAPGSGATSLFLVHFSPGTTKDACSSSHEIHTYLRRASHNKIPIFGGSSADCFTYSKNYQIAGDRIETDGVALAMIESEVLFGMGMSHGFTATHKTALVTRSEGHVVWELNGRPASEVLVDLIGRRGENGNAPEMPISSYPFGVSDLYGNSLLMVPEKFLEGGGIQFAPKMKENQVVSVMHGTAAALRGSAWEAYTKALQHGGLKKPSLALVVSCALRKQILKDRCEIEHLHRRSGVPVVGFHSFGEQGLSEEGFPVYSNQSVSVLAFADELNPIANLLNRRIHVYSELKSQLDVKRAQLKSLNQLNRIFRHGNTISELLPSLANELKSIFPDYDAAIYLTTDKEGGTYTIASATNFEEFPREMRSSPGTEEYLVTRLVAEEKQYGAIVFKSEPGRPALSEEERVMAKIVAHMTSGCLKKIETEERLKIKFQHIEILNRLGDELAKSMEADDRYQQIVHHIREILNLSIVSLWLIDAEQKILSKEAVDTDANTLFCELESEIDEKLTCWQVKHKTPQFLIRNLKETCPIEFPQGFAYNVISLPVMYRSELRGVLNLYTKSSYKWYLQQHHMAENIDFLSGISGQVAVFVENRNLYRHKTFFKEIHHRVKNNLQNIASLLRLQARRVDHRTARKALEDSIARIMSIAIVHETLSFGEMGKVELGTIVNRITAQASADLDNESTIHVDMCNQKVWLPSKPATSFALVLNEIIQNAVKYGIEPSRNGKIEIRVRQEDGFILLSVKDNGPGLPEGFDEAKDGNLGLMIVSTIIAGELNGSFSMASCGGTCVDISFPRPVVQFFEN